MSITAKALVQSRFAASTASTEYTVPAGAHAIIDKVTATNIDSGAQTITIYVVPNSQTAGSANTVVSAKSIAAGVTADLTEMKNQILNSGESLVFMASAASKIIIRASGREVT